MPQIHSDCNSSLQRRQVKTNPTSGEVALPGAVALDEICQPSVSCFSSCGLLLLHQFFSWEIFTLSNPMEKQHNYQLNTTLLRRRGSFAGSVWPSLIFFNWFIQLWFIQPEGVTFRNYLGEPAMSSSREGSMASWFQWLALGSRAAMTSCLTSLLLVPSVCTSGKLIL